MRIFAPIAMKLNLCLIFSAVVLIAIVAEATPRQVYHCVKQTAKNCLIANISAPDPSDSVVFSDLSDKTSLHIKEGQLLYFSRKLADQLGNVGKLQLGTLGVRELFLRPQLTAVEADGNHIATISFTADGEYRTEKLSLSDNRLATLDGFEVLVQLKELWLSSNELESVDMRVFERMKSLKKLALDRNRIAIIVAASPIVLTQLSYLNLGNNRLSKLDVSSWEFESLRELDVSGNDLVHIEHFHDRFVTLQLIALARNSWYCTWLDNVLQNFGKTYVTVQDKDQNCEGSSRADLCCLAELDSSTYDDNFEKLDKLQKTHERLKNTLNSKLREVETSQNKTLKDLNRRLEELEKHKASGGFIATDTTEGVTASHSARNKVLEIKDGWSSGMKEIEKQQEANRRVQQRLGLAIVELKRTFERDTKGIAELQAQFGQLKDHIRHVLENRDILDG